LYWLKLLDAGCFLPDAVLSSVITSIRDPVPSPSLPSLIRTSPRARFVERHGHPAPQYPGTRSLLCCPTRQQAVQHVEFARMPRSASAGSGRVSPRLEDLLGARRSPPAWNAGGPHCDSRSRSRSRSTVALSCGTIARPRAPGRSPPGRGADTRYRAGASLTSSQGRHQNGQLSFTHHRGWARFEDPARRGCLDGSSRAMASGPASAAAARAKRAF
jgi:hypothetical protein